MNMMLYPTGSAKGAAIPDLLPPWAVGFDRQVAELQGLAEAVGSSKGNYPPYDVVKFSDDEFSIDIALAGFGEEDLDIEVKDNVLTVTGTRPPEFEDEEFVHRGIGKRAFTRRFGLAEHMEIIGAKLAKGILRIDLERRLPEELKPRKIEIAS